MCMRSPMGLLLCTHRPCLRPWLSRISLAVNWRCRTEMRTSPFIKGFIRAYTEYFLCKPHHIPSYSYITSNNYYSAPMKNHRQNCLQRYRKYTEFSLSLIISPCSKTLVVLFYQTVPQSCCLYLLTYSISRLELTFLNMQAYSGTDNHGNALYWRKIETGGEYLHLLCRYSLMEPLECLLWADRNPSFRWQPNAIFESALVCYSGCRPRKRRRRLLWGSCRSRETSLRGRLLLMLRLRWHYQPWPRDLHIYNCIHL